MKNLNDYLVAEKLNIEQDYLGRPYQKFNPEKFFNLVVDDKMENELWRELKISSRVKINKERVYVNRQSATKTFYIIYNSQDELQQDYDRLAKRYPMDKGAWGTPLELDLRPGISVDIFKDTNYASAVGKPEVLRIDVDLDMNNKQIQDLKDKYFPPMQAPKLPFYGNPGDKNDGVGRQVQVGDIVAVMPRTGGTYNTQFRLGQVMEITNKMFSVVFDDGKVSSVRGQYMIIVQRGNEVIR